jgi:eukaryotic-like serine/threonine-protein kinase
MPKAREAAARAIALDDSLAEAHSMMGFIKAHYEYDWPGAEREFQHALKLNPSDPYAHLFYSNSYLSPLGRHDEAIAEIKMAIELDPFSPRIQSFLGRTYVWARRYDDALTHLQKTTQIFPSYAIDHQRLAHLYAYRGEYDKAIAEETRTRILAGEEPRSVLRWRPHCVMQSQPAGREAMNFRIDPIILRRLTRQTMALRSYTFDLERGQKRCKRSSRRTRSGSST